MKINMRSLINRKKQVKPRWRAFIISLLACNRHLKEVSKTVRRSSSWKRLSAYSLERNTFRTARLSHNFMLWTSFRLVSKGRYRAPSVWLSKWFNNRVERFRKIYNQHWKLTCWWRLTKRVTEKRWHEAVLKQTPRSTTTLRVPLLFSAWTIPIGRTSWLGTRSRRIHGARLPC